MIKLHQRQRQFRFQTGYAEGRVIELDFFFVITVRRMVAANDFEGAIC
jgi:hypothetical protein